MNSTYRPALREGITQKDKSDFENWIIDTNYIEHKYIQRYSSSDWRQYDSPFRNALARWHKRDMNQYPAAGISDSYFMEHYRDFANEIYRNAKKEIIKERQEKAAKKMPKYAMSSLLDGYHLENYVRDCVTHIRLETSVLSKLDKTNPTGHSGTVDDEIRDSYCVRSRSERVPVYIFKKVNDSDTHATGFTKDEAEACQKAYSSKDFIESLRDFDMSKASLPEDERDKDIEEHDFNFIDKSVTIESVAAIGKAHRVEASIFGMQRAMLWDGKEFSEINRLYDSTSLKTVLSLSNRRKQAAVNYDSTKASLEQSDLSLVKDFSDNVLIPSVDASTTSVSSSSKNYDAKDKMRIDDILKLSPSQREPAAERMAKLIKDPAKMKRRTAAAKDIAGATSDIFKAFEPYAKALGIDTTQL